MLLEPARLVRHGNRIPRTCLNQLNYGHLQHKTLWPWQLICTKKVQLTRDLGELGWQVDSNQQHEPAQSSENPQGWNEAAVPRDTHVQMWTWWKGWRISEQTFDTLSPGRNLNTVMEPPSPPPSTCLNSSVIGTLPPRFVQGPLQRFSSTQLCPFPRRGRGWRSSLGSGSLCAAEVAWNLAPRNLDSTPSKAWLLKTRLLSHFAFHVWALAVHLYWV